MNENQGMITMTFQVPVSMLPTVTDLVNKLYKITAADAEAIPLPESIDDVIRYCRERNSNVDPKRFWEYYENNDWKTKSGEPIRNWHKLLERWERTQTKNTCYRARNVYQIQNKPFQGDDFELTERMLEEAEKAKKAEEENEEEAPF